MSESEIQTACLPDEIVKEILSRIPVISLLQFRCVSKHWKDLISGPHFIKSHLKKALSSSTQHRILFPCISTSPLLSLSYNDINESLELDCPFLDPTNWIEILGSCNGLVCLNSGCDMIIYNPSTRKHFKPLLSPQQDLHCPFPVAYVYGFGCCSTNSNEMRVVRFPRFSREQWSSDIARNGLNSWTSGVASSCYGFIDTTGTFLNGFLHWVAYRRSNGYDDDHKVIASFNLSEETFTDLPLPSQNGSRTPPSCFLGVLQGCLSALCDDVDHIEVEIWLMKEYGVANSWMIFVKIPFQTWIENIWCMMPLGSLNEDEILLQIDQGWVVIYDTKRKSLRGCTREYYDLVGDAVVYVESLLSPQVLRLLY